LTLKSFLKNFTIEKKGSGPHFFSKSLGTIFIQCRHYSKFVETKHLVLVQYCSMKFFIERFEQYFHMKSRIENIFLSLFKDNFLHQIATRSFYKKFSLTNIYLTLKILFLLICSNIDRERNLFLLFIKKKSNLKFF
jgi:hypothetical protein